MRTGRCLPFVALGLLAGCSGQKQAAPTPTASSLTVSCDVTAFSAVGQQGHCAARVTLSNSTTQDSPAGVQWSSSDPGKVSVSTSGVISAVAPGSADIFALYLGLSAKQTIGVTVACAFSVAPTTVSFASGGGSQTVTLTAAPAGCAPSTWTASASSAALSVSPASGSGGATITLTAAANTGGAQTFTATIAGQTVTATIDAASPPPRVLSVTLVQGENLSGPFGGTVTGPNGFTCTLHQIDSIACPPVQFPDGQTVTLQVTLIPGESAPGDTPLFHTTGCDSATISSCTVTMRGDRSVTLAIGCAVCLNPLTASANYFLEAVRTSRHRLPSAVAAASAVTPFGRPFAISAVHAALPCFAQMNVPA